MNHVEDVVESDLCEVHHDFGDCLVAPILPFVQQLFLWLFKGQFRPHSGRVRGVVAFHTVVVYHVLCLVFMAHGNRPFLTVAGDVHDEDSRHVTHVEHLKPVH